MQVSSGTPLPGPGFCPPKSPRQVSSMFIMLASPHGPAGRSALLEAAAQLGVDMKGMGGVWRGMGELLRDCVMTRVLYGYKTSQLPTLA